MLCSKEEKRIANALARQEERAVKRAEAKAEAAYYQAQMKAERKEMKEALRAQEKEKAIEQAAARTRQLAEESDSGASEAAPMRTKVTKPGKVKWEAKKTKGISRKVRALLTHDFQIISG